MSVREQSDRRRRHRLRRRQGARECVRARGSPDPFIDLWSEIQIYFLK